MDGRTLHQCILNGINLIFLSKITSLNLNVRPNGRTDGRKDGWDHSCSTDFVDGDILVNSKYKGQRDRSIHPRYATLNFLDAIYFCKKSSLSHVPE